MRILIVAPEAVPFAKVGGLADVVGALPRTLEEAGHEVSLILPLYQSVRGNGRVLDRLRRSGEVTVGRGRIGFSVSRALIPGTRTATAYFVEHNDFFGYRDSLYGHPHGYGDNDLRYVFFCQAALEAASLLGMEPDIVHAHDWQTACVPLFLRTHRHDDPRFVRAATVFTIHNLAYQGTFRRESFALLNLPGHFLTWERLEHEHALCLMKAGILYADVFNTVSPSYAHEILFPGNGCGLEGLIRHRRDRLSGILNGIDTDIWNPETDPHIPANFSAGDLSGKATCKAALLRELDLWPAEERPLVGLVGRMVDQKGIDLVVHALAPFLERAAVRVAVLGSGAPELERRMRALADRYPRTLSFTTAFNDPLAHRIEAASDLFLMPSRFEPCGLNQLISMRYGTLPVVTPVGGLKDTVVACTPDNLAQGIANGFVMREPRVEALTQALDHALEVYVDRPTWARMVQTAMQEDVSWSRRGRDYVRLYESAITHHRHGLHA